MHDFSYAGNYIYFTIMDYIPGIAQVAGGVLLTIGFLNDSGVGEIPYSDASNTTLANAVANTNPVFTVEDVRKTNATSASLKIIGSILLVFGSGLELFYMKKNKDTSL